MLTSTSRLAISLVGLMLVACTASGPSQTTSSNAAANPAVIPTANTALRLQFPSRNGSIIWPTPLSGADLQVVFIGTDRQATGIVETTTTTVIRKPLTAPASGRLEVRAGSRLVGSANYDTKDDLVDIALDVQGAAFPLRVEPAETTAGIGNRVLRARLGSQLRLIIPERDTVLGEVTVDADGQVKSATNSLTGTLAGLRVNVVPSQMELGDSRVQVRLQPVETEFAAGNRQVRVVPGIPMTLAVGVNSVVIDGITAGPDGTVSQAQGLVKAQKNTLEPVLRYLRIDSGAYAGTWRLRRYEADFGTGGRTLAVLTGDRQLTFNFGNFDNETPTFDPDSPSGVVKEQAGGLTFNLVPITVDPGDLTAPYLVQPFETAFAAGKRQVYMPRIASKGTIRPNNGSETAGEFSLDAAGTLSTNSPSLSAGGGNLTFRTLSVRVEPDDLTVPFQVMPFETQYSSGARHITMLRGVGGRIVTNGLTLPFTIDPDGSLSSPDSRLVTGNGRIAAKIGR